jgi:hypothetical protein
MELRGDQSAKRPSRLRCREVAAACIPGLNATPPAMGPLRLAASLVFPTVSSATAPAATLARRVVGGDPNRGGQLFLLFGLCPAGVLPAANGEGVAPPFLRFLSAFGFFFSLLLRI